MSECCERCPACHRKLAPQPPPPPTVELVSEAVGELLDPRRRDDAAEFYRFLVHLPGLKGRSVTCSEAAKLIGLGRRTVNRKLAEAGLPTPRRILALGRILYTLAKAHQAKGRQTLRDFVSSHHRLWPDQFALSNTFHRELGVRPSEVWGVAPAEAVREAGVRRITLADGILDNREDIRHALEVAHG